MPIQTSGAEGQVGHIELVPEFEEGLRDLDGFSHILLIYQLHLINECRLSVIPFLDTQAHGIFATRSPTRPNPIGLSVVRLLLIEGTRISFANPDMIDGTPLLDIKPYVSEFDKVDPSREGWFSGRAQRASETFSDSRFIREK